VTPEEASRLISQGEGQRIEFKQSFAEERRAIESLCAFANADGGTVFVGVSNSGKFVGASIGANTLENFSNQIRANTQPPLYPTIEQLKIDGEEIVAATIEKARPGQLFYAFNVPYVRVGRTNQVMTPDEQRSRLLEVTSTESLAAKPLAGPESQPVDPLALGRTVARTGDIAHLRAIVRSTRNLYSSEWTSRIEALSRQSSETPRIPENQIYDFCIPYIEKFEADIQLVEGFGLTLTEVEYRDGLAEMFRIVQDWITLSNRLWPGETLRAVTGAPGLLALRILANWAAKAADDMSLDMLGLILTHSLEAIDAQGQASAVPLVERPDLFWPNALLDHADFAVQYIKERSWENPYLCQMFASRQDYLKGLSIFLFVAALTYDARQGGQGWPLYPGFKLIEGSSQTLRAFVDKLSSNASLVTSLAGMANEDRETFKAKWPERIRRLNEAELGSRHWSSHFNWRGIPEQL